MTHLFKSCWDILGIKPTQDAVAVRKAYARQLKSIDAENPELFQELRDAYDQAKATIKFNEKNHCQPPINPLDDETVPVIKQNLTTQFFEQNYAVERDAGQPDVNKLLAEPTPTNYQRDIIELVNLLEKNRYIDAVEYLKQLIKQSSYQTLDARLHFSGQLLLNIEEVSPFPCSFFQVMQESFGWSEHGDNPFQFDSLYFAAYSRCQEKVYGNPNVMLTNPQSKAPEPPYLIYGIVCYGLLKTIWHLLKEWGYV